MIRHSWHSPFSLPEKLRDAFVNRSFDFWTCLSTLVVAGIFLFANLGHYPLWDDESLVALGAKGILKTGDTVATIDHNIVAYRGGLLLENMRDRGLPPLGSYLTALSFAVFGAGAWSARLPFALIGLLTVALMLNWAITIGFTRGQLLVVALVLLANVSFFLFCRQCRYYSLVIGLSTLLAWLFTTWKYGNWTPFMMAFVAVMLFASHSLAFVMVIAASCTDYLIWGHKTRRLYLWQLSAFILPQMLGIAAILSIWNPMRTGFGQYTATNSVGERLQLLAWQLRDVVQCEFVSLPMLACVIWLAVKSQDRHLARGLTAIVVMLAVTSALSPQLVSHTSVADVRYVTPVLPLGIALGSRAIWLIARQNIAVSLALLVPCYFLNLGNGGPLLWCSLRSTPEAFIGELITPIEDPYTPAINWIRSNVRNRETALVLPDYFTYPLMFHAPEPLYAWQLEQAIGQFSHVEDSHIRGKIPPTYIVCFGPIIQDVTIAMARWRHQGILYEQVASFDVFWKDLYRPELFWRSFKTVRPRNVEFDCIYVFRQVPPSTAENAPH